jgi:hypothetical protein
MSYQIHKLTWEGIEIEARYDSAYFKDVVAHLEIETVAPKRARLPITQTGYRSRFHPIGLIEKLYEGDVVKCVTDWLNKEAQSKGWQDYVEDMRQGRLF